MPPLAVRGARIRPFHQRYIGYQVDAGRWIRLPLLHVRLRGSRRTVRTIALIDSGATVTFIPTELGSAIGLDVVENDVSATGAGGKFLNDVSTFDLEVLIEGRPVHRIRGQAHVPKDVGRVPYVVLGRDYLFQTYDIAFQEQRERVGLLPASKPANHQSGRA